MASLSRQLAAWIVGLRSNDLPLEVLDRVKGLTLHALVSAMLGSRSPAGRQAVKFILDEEGGVPRGATILVTGEKVTKGGAAFANSELAMSGGKLDSFRMLTHPGTSIIPAALVAAETSAASGEAYVTGIAAGYEVMARMAGDFIPTVMARGFHAGPVFGIFGAAIAAAKILGLNEEQVNSAIALCASLAGGNLEGARSGGKALREGAATRSALLAVALAQQGHVGGETVLEGEAGFYHAYAGSNTGQLTYSFTGDTQASFGRITEGLGKNWLLLETLYRIYTTPGYNLAHVDVTAQLCKEHNIDHKNIERIEAIVNWMETQYPSPAYPSRREDKLNGPGSTAYYTAWGAVRRGYPVLRGSVWGAPAEPDPPEVLDLMKRVKIIPSHTMTLFGPCISVHLRDGRCYTRQATGAEFAWDFEEEVARIKDAVPALPIPEDRFLRLVDCCRHLEQRPRAAELVDLTIPGRGDAT